MANLCYNFIVVTGEDTAKIKGIFVEGKTLVYEDMVNILGEGTSKGYLGTKWFDLDNVTFDSGVLKICGGSAWTPPIGFFQFLSKMYSIHVDMRYASWDMDLGGKCIIENNCADDHELSYMGYIMEYGGGLDNFLDNIKDREYKSIDDFYSEYEDDEDFLSRLSEEDKQEIEEAILQSI